MTGVQTCALPILPICDCGNVLKYIAEFVIEYQVSFYDDWSINYIKQNGGNYTPNENAWLECSKCKNEYEFVLDNKNITRGVKR